MKQKKTIRRKDGVVQNYTVGRTPRPAANGSAQARAEAKAAEMVLENRYIANPEALALAREKHASWQLSDDEVAELRSAVESTGVYFDDWTAVARGEAKVENHAPETSEFINDYFNREAEKFREDWEADDEFDGSFEEYLEAEGRVEVWAAAHEPGFKEAVEKDEAHLAALGFSQAEYQDVESWNNIFIKAATL